MARLICPWDMRDLDLDLLLSILSTPTAPFREGHVITLLSEVMTRAGVPFFADPVGNLVVGASNKKEYLARMKEKTREPLRIYIAHLDHPGFHGVAWRSSTELEVKWHGGSPTREIDNSKVWLADAEGSLGHGAFAESKMIPSGKAIESGVIRVADGSLKAKHPKDATRIYGGFGFRAPVWREGDLLYTKAADDLVGAFAVVSLAIAHFGRLGGKKRKGARPPFIGLLTRAEEVGFIGTIGHLELGWHKQAKRPLLCVSLETSRTLPGADIGKGPVVRLGDRATVFDSSALRVFSQLAQAALPDMHQRRIMDGGTCEATAATVYGLPCVGISVPLGNYHNQCFEGGPDSAGQHGPAPEFVHVEDVRGLLTLCHELLKPKQPWDDAWKPRLAEFKKDLKSYKALLRSDF